MFACRRGPNGVEAVQPGVQQLQEQGLQATPGVSGANMLEVCSASARDFEKPCLTAAFGFMHCTVSTTACRSGSFSGAALAVYGR